MSHKATTPVPRSAKRPEMLLLEREARKETIERKGKNYRFWLFRRKLYHIVTVYALIFGLIGAIVFLWKDYILKYDWLSIDTVTLKSNGIFNSEQAFSVMGIGPQDNIFSIDAAELEQRLKNVPPSAGLPSNARYPPTPRCWWTLTRAYPWPGLTARNWEFTREMPRTALWQTRKASSSPAWSRSTCLISGKSACPPSRSGRPVPANSATASASGNWKRP